MSERLHKHRADNTRWPPVAFRSLSKEAHIAVLQGAEDAGVTISEFVRVAVSERLKAMKRLGSVEGREVTGGVPSALFGGSNASGLPWKEKRDS